MLPTVIQLISLFKWFSCHIFTTDCSEFVGGV